jgi:hypothetical protein
MKFNLLLTNSLLNLLFVAIACQSSPVEESVAEMPTDTTTTEGIAEIPQAPKSENWLDINTAEGDTSIDTETMLYNILYKTQKIEQDAHDLKEDSTHRAGSAKYQTKCAVRAKAYLADLEKLNTAAKVWLDTKKFASIPELTIASCWLEEDGKSVTIVFAHPKEHGHETVSGYAWNSDTLCLPADFTMEKYASLQKAIKAGLVYAMPMMEEPETVRATSVEQIAYNSSSKPKQAAYLRSQINQILTLAQKDPKLKAKKLPSPTTYDAWEKKQGWNTADLAIKGRKIVLMKLAAQL